MSAILILASVGAVAVLLFLVVRSRSDERITMPHHTIHTMGSGMGPGTGMQGGPDTIESLVRAGRKIEAIKLLREQKGIGLKEAKDEIDELFRRR